MIRCAGAFPFVGMVPSAWADEKPLLRIGIMTDTHIGETKASCGRVKLACELFRRQNVDMVAHVGDLADYHYPKGYAAYRSVVDEAFEGLAPEARPQELFVYAAHDTFAYGGRQKRSEWPKYIDEAYSDMQRLVRAPNGPYASGSIKGFPYVTFPQTGTKGVDWPRIEKMVADAVAANPGKPVFVFAHVPPAGTTRTGRGDSKDVFEVIENRKISAARVVFGAEPKDYKLFEYILRYYTGLHFSPAVDTVVKDIARNPKRIQREARKQTSATGIGTKSQQAIKLQQEQNKLNRKIKSRGQRQAEEKREFELKQQKKREKHRGH